MKNKKKFLLKSRKGFTLVEVLVALIIFYLGIVGIFRAYIFLLGRMGYLTNRLYATVMLDNKIEDIERMLRAYKVFPSEFDQSETVDIGGRKVDFNSKMSIKEVDGLFDVFKVDLTLSWNQSGNIIRISRSSYISDTLFPE